MKNDNDSRVSLTQALQDMKMEQGESFSLATVNLAKYGDLNFYLKSPYFCVIIYL